MGEPVIIQENVIAFPISYFTTYLPEYEFVFTNLNPMELGWPVHRNRQWILSFAQLTIPSCYVVATLDHNNHEIYNSCCDDDGNVVWSPGLET